MSFEKRNKIPLYLQLLRDKETVAETVNPYRRVQLNRLLNYSERYQRSFDPFITFIVPSGPTQASVTGQCVAYMASVVLKVI